MLPRRGPAAISREAEALLAEAELAPGPDYSKPVQELRAHARAGCAPGCQAAVRRSGVAISDIEIAGVPSMIIDPPSPQHGRRIVYLFGGGFTLGSPFEDLPISTALSVRTGAQVICPHYPLAPEYPYPAALDACSAVTRAVLAASPDTCLAGESAGGNLSVAVMHCLRAENGPLPKAAALMSPATDLGNFGDSLHAGRDPFLRAADVEYCMAAYLPRGTDVTDPCVSPIFGDFDPSFPPTMITTGTRDLLASSCIRLDRTMRNAGANCDLRIWEGMWHVFEFYPGTPEAEASLTELSDFLNRHFT